MSDPQPTEQPTDQRTDQQRGPGLLADLAKTVIEAALDAEMEEHLAGCDQARRLHGRRNSRNGTRTKTVRTVIGPVTIEVPRDRWGTFEPMTVGKWQREVVGIDRILLPIAAKNAPRHETIELLAQVYPSDAPDRTLRRIYDLTRTRLAGWHDRTIDAPYAVLHVHMSTLRTDRGNPAGFPVVSVVGATTPDDDGRRRRELLSLYAVQADRSSDSWRAVVHDLHRRDLRGVRSVVGAAAAPFRAAVAGTWQIAN